MHNNGALRRAHEVVFLSCQQDGNADDERAETEEIRRPEANLLLQLCCRKTRERADIDAEVEDLELISACFRLLLVGSSDHVNPLDRDSRVNNDSFAALLDTDGLLGTSVLLCDQRADVGLYTSSSQPDHEHGNYKAWKGKSVLDGYRQRRGKQNHDSGKVYVRKIEDGFIFAEILVGNDGAENWRDIAPELKEVGQACRAGLAEA